MNDVTAVVVSAVVLFCGALFVYLVVQVFRNY